MPGPNNEVDLTKFFRKVNEFWYNEANNEENNEVILGQFSGFWGLWRRVEWSKTSKISQISNLNVLNIVKYCFTRCVKSQKCDYGQKIWPRILIHSKPGEQLTIVTLYGLL